MSVENIFGLQNKHRSERYVEYDWIVSKLTWPSSILDVGAMDGAGTIEFFWDWLKKHGYDDYTTLDLIEEARGYKTDIVADIRDSGIESDSYDYVICISTLEHIEDPRKAVDEMIRIAERKVLITIPYGKAQKHSWGIQYDENLLKQLMKDITYEADLFVYHQDHGWMRGVEEMLKNRGYATGGAPYAAGVACIEVKL